MLITHHNIIFRITCYSNKALFWCKATTCVMFSLMTGLEVPKRAEIGGGGGGGVARKGGLYSRWKKAQTFSILWLYKITAHP